MSNSRGVLVDFLVRIASDWDIDKIVKIHNQAKEHLCSYMSSPKIVEKLIPSIYVLEFEYEMFCYEVIGYQYFRIYKKKEGSRLYELCIDTDYKGKGFGRLFKEQLHLLLPHPIWLKTSKRNVAKRTLDRSLGYKPVDEEIFWNKRKHRYSRLITYRLD